MSTRKSFPSCFGPRSPARLNLSLKETQQEIIVQNDFYRIAFSKKNGAVNYLTAGNAVRPVIDGNVNMSLWQMDAEDKSWIESGICDAAKNKSFEWNWDAGTAGWFFVYKPVKDCTVKVEFTFDGTETILGACIGGEPVGKTTFLFHAAGIAFTVDGLKQVTLPHLHGIGLNRDSMSPENSGRNRILRRSAILPRWKQTAECGILYGAGERDISAGDY